MKIIFAIVAAGWLLVSGLALAENQEATDDLSISAQEECKPKAFVIPLPYKKGSAVAEEVLEGTTFTNKDDVDIPGTMLNKGAVTINPGKDPQDIPEGYHNGTGSVTGDPALVPANINSGVTIFDVVGTSIKAHGTAATYHVLQGESFSNDAGRDTGTMPNNGRVTITPGTSDQQIPIGYHDGRGQVNGDPNLVSQNIIKDKQIYGVTGTAQCATKSKIIELFKRCYEDCDEYFAGEQNYIFGCLHGCAYFKGQLHLDIDLEC